jgi:hypothetical protein
VVIFGECETRGDWSAIPGNWEKVQKSEHAAEGNVSLMMKKMKTERCTFELALSYVWLSKGSRGMGKRRARGTRKTCAMEANTGRIKFRPQMSFGYGEWRIGV